VSGIGGLQGQAGGDADDKGGNTDQDGAPASGGDAQASSRALVPRSARTPQRDELAVWAIALIGLQMGVSTAPPLPIRLLLLPVYGMEALLRAVAAQSTREELARAVRKRQLGE
jgi:hypothetical protein